MKKLFTILALVSMVLMPMTVFAESTTKMDYSCVASELDNNVQVCTVTATTTGDSVTELNVKMTEVNATIDQASIEAGSGWTVDKTGYPTIKLTNELGAVGEKYTLFTFQYTKATTGEECKIMLEAAGDAVTIVPAEQITDTPTENKKTGVTLPYVFLGAAMLIAGYAFVATKNKSKMYKI